MSLTKPILSTVPAWDVADGYTFTFNVIGGDAVVGSTLYIVNNSTGTTAYSLSVTSYSYSITVPPNAVGLSNGTYYSAYVVTTNSNGDLSPNSNTIQFYCYSTPSWVITNITQGSIVTNSSIAPQAQYSQAQGEALNDYTFILYDSNQLQLATSGTQYTGSSAGSITVSYDFYGLEDNLAYYIRATGHTVEGTVLDTGYIRFTTDYIRPSTYSILSLENNCDEGYIVYSSLAIDIEGTAFPTPPTYTTDGIDLTELGSYVTWGSGFVINGNFTLKAWVVNPTLNSELITLNNIDNGSISIQYIEDWNDNTKVVVLVVVNNSYFIYSEAITAPASTDLLCIQVRRISDVYEVKLEVVS